MTPRLWLFLLPALCWACAATDPGRPAARQQSFGQRVALRVELPTGYVLQSEAGETFEVHHVWREKPRPLPEEAQLAFYLGAFALSQCPAQAARTPAALTPADREWRPCHTSVAGLNVREKFLPAGRGLVLHVFITGRNPAEMERLQTIAETVAETE